ncbi:MAG: ACP S-malonyltransferase [Bacteroidota bacterium]|nr:ACP S-malonyltransferase [Bacteroidota bacterium]
MKAYLFPGQGSQFSGMAKDLYENSGKAREILDEANEILGFKITDTMFSGSDDELKQTRITQPAIFLHSIALVHAVGDRFQPAMAAGHSLGEFSALAATGAMDWQDALRLVAARANAMQRACELEPSTMAAVLGMDDEIILKICITVDDLVVPANYNCPGQVVISGTVGGVEKAGELLKEAGAKRVIILNVGGAFHSPLMEPARTELAEAIMNTRFRAPVCPVYQNVNAKPSRDPADIQQNLIAQLTAPVLWTQTISQMNIDGNPLFIESGPGNVLQGLVKKIDRASETASLKFEE